MAQDIGNCRIFIRDDGSEDNSVLIIEKFASRFPDRVRVITEPRAPWIRQELGAAEGEGLKFVNSELHFLLQNAFWQIPEGLMRTFVRYAGFRLGLIEHILPLWFKRLIAMNKGYFSLN